MKFFSCCAREQSRGAAAGRGPRPGLQQWPSRNGGGRYCPAHAPALRTVLLQQAAAAGAPTYASCYADKTYGLFHCQNWSLVLAINKAASTIPWPSNRFSAERHVTSAGGAVLQRRGLLPAQAIAWRKATAYNSGRLCCTIVPLGLDAPRRRRRRLRLPCHTPGALLYQVVRKEQPSLCATRMDPCSSFN